MSLGKMFIHKCNIMHHDDEMRGNYTKKTPARIYENISCRFVRKSSRNTSENGLNHGRIKVSVYYTLMLPAYVVIRNGDIVTWNKEPGVEFTVGDPFSPSDRYIKVALEKEGEA